MKIGIHVLSVALAAVGWFRLSAAQEYSFTEEQLRNANRTLSIGYILYHGFEPLDVFGPMEFLFSLSYRYNMTLSLIANNTGPVHVRPPIHHMPDGSAMNMSNLINFEVLATHTFATAPPLDVIIVPGGLGANTLIELNDRSIEDFVAARFPSTSYILSVCTGSALLARSGILDGRRATSNKEVFEWVVGFGPNTTWEPNARWVHDGKIWTSSGVSAGMDMIVAFLREIYGDPKVNNVVNGVEYAPHVDPDWDAFAVLHDVPGANKSRSMVDNVSPLPPYPDDMAES